jgi:hypothetical protein
MIFILLFHSFGAKLHKEAKDNKEQEDEEKEDGGGGHPIPCFLTITVQDSGIGMNVDEQARIFKRFSQANTRTSKVLIYFYFNVYFNYFFPILLFSRISGLFLILIIILLFVFIYFR